MREINMIAKPPTSYQNKVLRTFVNSKNATETGRKIGVYNKDSNACKSVTDTIRSPNLKVRMCNLFDFIGPTEEFVAQKLYDLARMQKVSYFSKDGMVIDTKTDEDGHLQLKAIEQIAELRGMKVARSEKLNVNVNIDNPDTIPTEELDGMIHTLTNEIKDAEYEVIEDA